MNNSSQFQRLKIGIFGGTFDPPHLGHLILASEVLRQLSLDKVLWVITPDSPFKTDQQKTAIEHRIEMVRRSISGNPSFEISLVELQRPGPHYTVDTVRVLREQFSEASLTLILGGDSIAQFHHWHEPDEILHLLDTIGVMLRPGEGFSIQRSIDLTPEIKNKIKVVQAPLLQISSTDLRSRIHSGGHFRYYLSENVYKYILENKLYH